MTHGLVLCFGNLDIREHIDDNVYVGPASCRCNITIQLITNRINCYLANNYGAVGKLPVQAFNMWATSITATWFADEKLASLSIDSPTNLRTADEVGLLVALWCGLTSDRIETENGTHDFSFGFHVGELVVVPTGARICNEGRLRTDGGHVKVAQSKTDQAKRQGSLGGQFGVNVGRWLGALTKAEIDVGGKTDRTVSRTEQIDREFIQPFWRVADAGHNFWRVFGIGLNPENVLENRIMGDEPLCRIQAETNCASFDVKVSFRCSLRDLWFRRNDNVQTPPDFRFHKEGAEQNRKAVAKRVIALAMSRTAGLSNPGDVESNVVLAEQTLIARRTSDSGEA